MQPRHGRVLGARFGLSRFAPVGAALGPEHPDHSCAEHDDDAQQRQQHQGQHGHPGVALVDPGPVTPTSSVAAASSSTGGNAKKRTFQYRPATSTCACLCAQRRHCRRPTVSPTLTGVEDASPSTAAITQSASTSADVRPGTYWLMPAEQRTRESAVRSWVRTPPAPPVEQRKWIGDQHRRAARPPRAWTNRVPVRPAGPAAAVRPLPDGAAEVRAAQHGRDRGRD